MYTAIIPTYNNAATLSNVIEKVLDAGYPVIVVNDGSTDGTAEILESFGDRIVKVSYRRNRGKGYAISKGLREALRLGYTHAVTIDSDGQHNPADIARLIEISKKEPEAIIVGDRLIESGAQNGGSKFANKFANFWFKVQTGRSGVDTQSGFRLYPLKKVASIRVVGRRYEGELELLVKASWRLVDIKSCAIKAYYPPKEQRVSHFRPFQDFSRISVLNTILTPLALLYGYPSMGIRKVLKRRGK